MHPILFKIPLPHWKLPAFFGGGELHAFPIYAYGVMLGLSRWYKWEGWLWLVLPLLGLFVLLQLLRFVIRPKRGEGESSSH